MKAFGAGIATSFAFCYCTNMTTVTIPKKLAEKGDFVIVQRMEYEDLLELKKGKEFTPTSAQRKALSRAEANLKQGKTLPYHEVAKKLGFAN